MGLMNVGRQKYRQLSHWCLNTVPLRFIWLLKS